MVIAAATGVSVASLNPERKAMAKKVEEAMGRAVQEAVSKDIHDPERMKAMMLEAKQKAIRGS